MEVNVFARQKDGSIGSEEVACAFYIIIPFIPHVSLQKLYENITYTIITYP